MNTPPCGENERDRGHANELRSVMGDAGGGGWWCGYLRRFVYFHVRVGGAQEIVDDLVVDLEVRDPQQELALGRLVREGRWRERGVNTGQHEHEHARGLLRVRARYLLDVGEDVLDGEWNHARVLGGPLHCVGLARVGLAVGEDGTYQATRARACEQVLSLARG